MALADGEISGREERRLGRRAAELGIEAERASELREDVEAGTVEGPSAPG